MRRRVSLRMIAETPARSGVPRCRLATVGSRCTPRRAWRRGGKTRWSGCAGLCCAPRRTSRGWHGRVTGRWCTDSSVRERTARSWLWFEPLVLIERLAALVPQPHRDLVTYHGAFAPAASHRERVVPVPPADEGERPAFRSRQWRPCRAIGEKRETKPHWRRRWTWAELMRRSFGVDVLVCPHCQSRRHLLTLVTDPRTITRVLSHLRLPAKLPPLSTARPPPEAPACRAE